jgi:prepilin-type N-terminal cleavage/methylation domain-containing protein
MRVVFKALNFKGFPAKGSRKNAFTLIEVLAVVTIIGILAALAYSSLMDLILTNRAKESAQVMRSVAETAIMEGKRLNKIMEIKVSGGNIQYKDTSETDDKAIKQSLGGGFTGSNIDPTCVAIEDKNNFNDGKKYVEPKTGISGMIAEGYFVACGAKDYCAAAVKTKANNSFRACIKRGKSASWEAI